MTPQTFVVEGRPGAREAQYLVVLGGKLTWESVFRFKQALGESQAPTTILDLTQVSFVDSAGLGSLVHAHVSHTKEGRKVVLVGVTERVAELLRISGLTPVLTIFDTLENAEAALA